MANRLQALLSRSAMLDAEIRDEQSRPEPDALRLQALKRAKLAIRDDVERMRSVGMSLAG